MVKPQEVVVDEYSNEIAFNRLLDTMDKASMGVQRDKGTRFETLIKDWLKREVSYRDLFIEVQTWKEWANQHRDLAGNAKDIGIDLVATNADGNTFTAIQCKFYGKDEIVPKSGIDSFIASSNKPYFTNRFIIATNERWTENVENELRHLNPPVTLITRTVLAHSMIDWAAYLEGRNIERSKKKPRDYQKTAISDVLEGFKDHDRGKLIMACGTGKTFTSLKIAEELYRQNKAPIMFLVPSLALLSQTLSDWKQQCSYPIHAFAVCSDSTTGKADPELIDSLTVRGELAYPATTDAKKLASEVVKAVSEPGMTVIFSTYQSIDVVHQAQEQYGMPRLGLVVCDEAHRTAGGRYANEQETQFTRVHDDKYIAADKRLYMTATPKVYGGDAKKQADEGDVVLYSMDDEGVFGPTFHTISFSQAVQLKSLVDYKVIVLTVDQDLIGESSSYLALQEGGMSIDDIGKVIGCWRALSKRDLQGEISMGDDLQPMKRAVGFAQVIDPSKKYERVSSRAFALQFQNAIENFKRNLHDKLTDNGKKIINEEEFSRNNGLKCLTRHIDGSMCATEKENLLSWLREKPGEDECKILFNVRCLSEGVDVPSLDAVIFFSPRKSQVDVVQTVGRVMRLSKETNKQRGYVIIPIVTPPGYSADLTLDNNRSFDVVWQVLRALKSIDSNFGTMVDGQLGKVNPDKMEVICFSNHRVSKKTKSERKPGEGKSGGSSSSTKRKKLTDEEIQEQFTLDFGRNEFLEDQIKARIVKRVGNRKEWEDWAEDVGNICKDQINNIKKVLTDEKNVKSKKAFEGFAKELKATLNGDLDSEEMIAMLGQHMVTKPIMDALFKDYPFMDQNPISKAMSAMIDALDKEGMKKANQLLKSFYDAVDVRTRNIKTNGERQTVIKELFEKFFKYAFKKTQEKMVEFIGD